MPDFDEFLTRAGATLDARERDDGYARAVNRPGADLYGTAAAIGMLIALGELPTGEHAKQLAGVIRGFERPDGTFRDDTHGENHRAATALTTLVALGEEPALPARITALMRDRGASAFLEGLDWANPWPTSHDAAGVLALLMVSVPPDERERDAWLAEYLQWLDANADPRTGLWRAAQMGDPHDDPGLFGNLGCSFHLHFLYERLGRPWPNPTGVVDVGLHLYHDTDAVVRRDEAEWGFRQLDWAYSVGRAARGGHRRVEVARTLLNLAERAAEAFNARDAADDDLHVVQARVGLVAELARHLPERIGTGGRELTSIVDVRPFI